MDFSRAELLDLYKIALEEYRFEVKLNMERMIHYVVFNTALLSAATGLLKLAGDPILDIFVALLFLIGVFTAWLGRRAVKRGHEYYRRTIYKKTLIEDLLGLHQPVKDYPGASLAITTTYGQSHVHQMLYNPDSIGKPPSKTSIVHGAVVILWLLTVADIAGLIAGTGPVIMLVAKHFVRIM